MEMRDRGLRIRAMKRKGDAITKKSTDDDGTVMMENPTRAAVEMTGTETCAAPNAPKQFGPSPPLTAVSTPPHPPSHVQPQHARTTRSEELQALAVRQTRVSPQVPPRQLQMSLPRPLVLCCCCGF